MTNQEIKEFILEVHAAATFDEGGEWLNVHIEATEWRRLAKLLRNGTLLFDYLFCITCIDWQTHLTMVYHLSSTIFRHNIVIKSKVDRDDAQIGTVSDIWRTAEFHEREVLP